jgi:hypothetical protein
MGESVPREAARCCQDHGMSDTPDPCWSSADLAEELRRFEAELRASGLKESSIKTYVGRVDTFLRWLRGHYAPQGRRV